MTRKTEQRRALFSGADGFTLNETARLLGAEWNEEVRHVARALLRALKKGEFDAPPEWKTFEPERLINLFVPESEKPDYAYRLQLLSDDKLTGATIDSQSVSVLFIEEMQVGNEGDFGDRVFMPVKAIIRFCASGNLPVPVYLAPPEPDKRGAALETEDVYGALRSLQCKVPVQIPVLAKMVAEKLGRTVTPQMVCFKNALTRARTEGIVKVPRVGRPPKR